MTVCLLGHRGAGKSTFLARITSRPTFDLDDEVARRAGRSVVEIFDTDGEAHFRGLEIQTLAELLADPTEKCVAIGAGYAGARPDAFVLWIRRETDADGRIFLNRPRLNSAVPPLDEYRERFAAREARYRAWADQTLTLPEGYDGGLEDIVETAWTLPFDLTDRPGRRTRSKPRRLEVRDDLSGDVHFADPRPPVRRLYAYRVPRASGEVPPPIDPRVADEDWALELGPPPRAFTITSVHDGTLDAAIANLASFGTGVAKLAVEIKTFADLKRGHRWWLEDPNARAFLPRSANGRWRWYRSLFGPRMPIHFGREDEGTADDQPLAWQSRLQPELKRAFAAVLGTPVTHSRTPLAHRAYFAARAMPVVAIDVAVDEADVAWALLKELGLTHAAVTAPLKTWACGICDELTPRARALGAVNTLHVAHGRVSGTNTDVTALERVRDELPSFPVAWLWGGGGVVASVRSAWPHARRVPARSGVPAGNEDEFGPAPDLVIWATGRTRPFRYPPPRVRPALVLDLNYGEDSPAREWALTRGLNYQSGLRMFDLQADAQRTFWTSIEEGITRARQPIR